MSSAFLLGFGLVCALVFSGWVGAVTLRYVFGEPE